MKITVYTTPTCGYCHQLKDYLSEKGFEFEEINIADPAHADALEYVAREAGMAATPFTVIGEHKILGFDREKIDAALAEVKN